MEKIALLTERNDRVPSTDFFDNRMNVGQVFAICDEWEPVRPNNRIDFRLGLCLYFGVAGKNVEESRGGADSSFCTSYGLTKIVISGRYMMCYV